MNRGIPPVAVLLIIMILVPLTVVGFLAFPSAQNRPADQALEPVKMEEALKEFRFIHPSIDSRGLTMNGIRTGVFWTELRTRFVQGVDVVELLEENSGSFAISARDSLIILRVDVVDDSVTEVSSLRGNSVSLDGILLVALGQDINELRSVPVFRGIVLPSGAGGFRYSHPATGDTLFAGYASDKIAFLRLRANEK